VPERFVINNDFAVYVRCTTSRHIFFIYAFSKFIAFCFQLYEVDFLL